MAVHSSMGATKKQAQRVTNVALVPAPVMGMDARTPLATNNNNVCIYTYNLVPSEYGLRVRKGSREWQTEITSGASNGVGTLIAFNNPIVEEQLFAVTNEGIFDVTVVGDAPVLEIAFPNNSTGAGYGSYINYIDDSGKAWIFYADQLNGLFQYDSDTGLWEVPTGITGIDPETITFVTVHKLRIWFCVRDSSIGYYLPINSIAGAVESFNFGIKFEHGGSLVGLFNWTVDGGIGVNDYFVAISSLGDVMPYQGSDPSQTDWSIVGAYYIGQLPKGTQCVSQYGGNLTILSSYGITQMSDLLRGVDPRLPNENSISSRIAPLIRIEMIKYINEYGWSMSYMPNIASLVIVRPKSLDNVFIQYVFNIVVGGWGIWRGLQINSIVEYNNATYFGSYDNKVYAMDVPKDNITFAPVEGVVNGDDIEFSTLLQYSDFGSGGTFKRGKLVRPDFLSTENIAFQTKFFYDYAYGQIDTSINPPASTNDEWDIGLWDQAIWQAGVLKDFNLVLGGSGIGRMVSVAIKGRAVADTTLASMDVFWDAGGSL